VLINRNAGSGTRILLDRVLEGLMVEGLALSERRGQETGRISLRIPGYGVQAKSHTAVAAAIAQGRADWGVCIDTVATMYGLDAIPMRDEHYDFVIPRDRLARPAVVEFLKVLAREVTTARLAGMGFRR
jgi:putative molybdopterin biosynthesis protein